MNLTWKQSTKSHNPRIHAFVDGVPYCQAGKQSVRYGNTFVDFEVVPGMILGRMCSICFNRFLRVPPRALNGQMMKGSNQPALEESDESKNWRTTPRDTPRVKPKPNYVTRLVESPCGCLGTSGNLPPMPNCRACSGSGIKRDKIREVS